MQRTSEELSRSAKEKTVTRSGFSRAEQIHMDRFIDLNILIDSKNSDGSLRVDIPNDKIAEFIKIWGQLIAPGYWCEYVGPKTGFLFKLPSGEFKHIEFTDEYSQLQINKMMRNYIPSWELSQDLWQWIYSCDIFTEWI